MSLSQIYEQDNSNYKILIVDDTPKNIQLLANLLSKEAYQLGYAQNGKQALDIVGKSSFDLILLDVMMPEMDGFEVCRHLKSSPNTKNIPVIFLTAKTDEESIIKGFQVGGVDYLTKPFNSEELKIRVKTHLESSIFKQKLVDMNNQLIREIEGRQAAELKLSIVASETDNGVVIFDGNGDMEWQNPSMSRLYEGTNVHANLRIGANITEISENPNIKGILDECISTGKSQVFETEYKLPERKMLWMQTTMTPIFNDDKQIDKIITIDSDITNIKKAEKEIKIQNEKITDSIKYALRIQHAILPPIKKLDYYFPNSFIFLSPKDIVSGDFFWIQESEDKVYVAAVDCTGHGVPGAFMSIISTNLLNKAIFQENIGNPAEILNYLNKEVKATLQSEGSSDVKDGMDIALCSFDKDMKKIEFAGAYNSLYLIRNGELIEYKADSNPIGERMVRGKSSFTLHEADLQKNDRLYIFSDGYVDQFGGVDRRKFLKKNFRELLIKTSTIGIFEQYDELKKAFYDWKGDLDQIDDVLVVGIEI